jgi:hypothetical protein
MELGLAEVPCHLLDLTRELRSEAVTRCLRYRDDARQGSSSPPGIFSGSGERRREGKRWRRRVVEYITKVFGQWMEPKVKFSRRCVLETTLLES